MARTYANIRVTIWDDPDFCALSPGAQRTYFMLVTQSDIAACGSLPLTLRRWSKTVAESERGQQSAWLDELAEALFVVIDDDTEELLVRTFVKWDEGYKHSKRLLAVLSTARALRSPILRSVVADELAKLGINFEGTPNPPRTAGLPPDTQRIPNPMATDSRRSVVTEVSTESTPETTLREQGAAGSHEPSPAHPKHCSKHDHWDHDGASRNSGYDRADDEARQHADDLTRQRAKQAAAKARDNCQRCAGSGWLLDTDPAIKCTHERSATA